MAAGAWRGVQADHRSALPVERFACPANPGADRLGGASVGQHGRGRARVGQARRGSAGAAVPVRAGLAEPEEIGGDLGAADRPGGSRAGQRADGSGYAPAGNRGSQGISACTETTRARCEKGTEPVFATVSEGSAAKRSLKLLQERCGQVRTVRNRGVRSTLLVPIAMRTFYRVPSVTCPSFTRWLTRTARTRTASRTAGPSAESSPSSSFRSSQ